MMLGVAFGANGQVFHVPSPGSGSQEMRSRSGAVRTPAMNVQRKAAPQHIQGWGGAAISEVEKYGTLRLVMEEDFSKMSAGSIEEPEVDTKLTYRESDPEWTYPWWNMRTEFTQLPHWGGGAEGLAQAGQAGGCYYMKCVDNEPYAPHQAHINTPPLDVSKDGAIAVFEFKARSRDAESLYPGLYIEFAETNNMGPTWRTPEDPIVTDEVPAEWTTYRILMRGCGPTTLFHLVAMQPGEVYIDDIKVYQLVPFVATPEPQAHSQYKGTSFTANWSAVDGADKYLLSLYYKEEIPAEDPRMGSTYKDVDVFRDKEVTDNKYEVTGVESGQTYYYTLKAVKGDKVSVESFPYRVYDLEVPVMKQPEILDGWTYTASWEAVPHADVYNYWAYDVRKAQADGPFTVTYEDFTGVLGLDGYPTGFVMEDPQDQTYDEYYSNEIDQQGWCATNGAPYTDYICIDAYHYMYNGQQSGFISPEFDMSKDGGKFTVEADLAGRACTVWLSDDKQEQRITQACVAVFNWNEAKGDYDQVELVYPDGDKQITTQWGHYTFTLTKGSERTVFGLFAVYAPDNLYIDNFKVTQNYKEGESLMEPFRYSRFHGSRDGQNPTSIDIEVPERVQLNDIYHKVSAYGRQADRYGQSYDNRESDFSPLEFVMTSQSGVSDVAVDNNESAPAEYYRIDGVRVEGQPTPGIYVVRNGSEVRKVVVK